MSKEIDVMKLPVFAAADVFPMMFEDELNELAADIEANGLQESIVIGEVEGKMMLIDGRNRREACRRANVKPIARELNGQDPTAFVISANVARRHMTASARAMAVAMIYPAPAERKRKGSDVSKLNINKGRLSQARTVLGWSRDRAEGVLRRGESLDAAYKEAIEAEKAGESDDKRLADLRAKSPELADKVVEGELTLAGAIAEYHEREKLAAAQRANVFATVGKFQYVASLVKSDATIENVVEKLTGYVSEFEQQEKCKLTDLRKSLVQLNKGIPDLIEALKGLKE